MKRFKSMQVLPTSAFLLLALGLTACDSSVAPPDLAQAESPSAVSASAASASAGAVTSTSPIFTFPVIGPHDGESTLIRTKNGINFRFATNSLEPGHAYTLWIVIWNEPENCVDGCDGADLFTVDAVPDMLYGAGHVVGGSGQATFSGRIQVGDASASVQAPLGLAPNGLIDPYGAEVHLVLHHHGEKIPAFMPDMIKTLAGGCYDTGVGGPGAPTPWNDFAGSAGYDQEYGRLGPNTCLSVLASVHQPQP
ncbi:MAG: hypothetical protein ACR2GQ_06795 [Gemmatimonadota bacterium]